VTTAVVVGSGPNGLAAAAHLAQRGVTVTVLEAADRPGGGLRSSVRDGVVHDDCSAFHPMGVGSPFLRSLDLTAHGLTWRWPEVQLAHPLDDGSAAALWRSVDDTARALGADEESWRRTFEPLVAGIDELVADALGPLLRWPDHPVAMARFGLRAVAPATWMARRFETAAGRALLGGIAAHSFRPLTAPLTSSVALLLGAAGHAYGWPVAEGGSQAIADALIALLGAHGGTIETGRRVESLAELEPTDLVLLDVAPPAVAEIAGDRLPARVARAYRRYRFGPAAFKVDLAVDGDVPWTAAEAHRAGTVHLGGSFEEIATAEAAVSRGHMPARPFVLVGQQYLADPSRSAGSINPVWAYAHVPAGFDGDATSAVLDQLERFAPGTRERIVGVHTRRPADLATANPNFVGGDISCGANTARQLLARPRLTRHPYATGIPGVFMCSAATPPGAGVHGLGGFHAAEAALASLS